MICFLYQWPSSHFHSCSICLYLLLVLVSKKKIVLVGENSMKNTFVYLIWYFGHIHTCPFSQFASHSSEFCAIVFLIQNDFHFLSSFKQPQVHSCKWDMRHYKADKRQRNVKTKKTRNFQHFSPNLRISFDRLFEKRESKHYHQLPQIHICMFHLKCAPFSAFESTNKRNIFRHSYTHKKNKN